MIGTTKTWISDRGFGFLALPDARDVFVHISEVQRAGYESLAVGQRVKFEMATSTRTGKTAAKKYCAARTNNFTTQT